MIVTTTEFIFGITALPAAAVAWLKVIARYEREKLKMATCQHELYEDYHDYLHSWKLYCRKCHYQEDITAKKKQERRGDLGDR